MTPGDHEPVRRAPRAACRSGFSVRPDALDAAAEAADRIGTQTTPDLLVVFATPEHAGRMGTVQDTLRDRTGARHVVAVTGEGVLAGSSERERAPGLSCLAMSLPGVRVHP